MPGADGESFRRSATAAFWFTTQTSRSPSPSTVTPAARGRGVGGCLLEAAIAHARASGCRRLTLLTDADNAGAQRFYRRRGFVASPMLPFRLALD